MSGAREPLKWVILFEDATIETVEAASQGEAKDKALAKRKAKKESQNEIR